jgi:hypothetical protein
MEINLAFLGYVGSGSMSLFPGRIRGVEKTEPKQLIRIAYAKQKTMIK